MSTLALEGFNFSSLSSQKSMTYTAKIFIQQLHKTVDDFKCDQLIVLLFNCTTEIQAGIPEYIQTKRKKHQP